MPDENADLKADIKRIELQSETRYNEIRTRLHELNNQLQRHELDLSLSAKDRQSLREHIRELRNKIDELDDIIRGKSPSQKGLIEMIGEAARNIIDIKEGQERVAKQRHFDDQTNKASLNRIEVDINALKSEKDVRKGGLSVFEKLIGISISVVIVLMSFVSMGVALGWWGKH